MPLYELDGVQPKLDAESWCAPDANLIGNVVLEAGASVWFGSTLRGDNEEIRVGAGSNVQENCVLHTDMGFPLSIGAGCTIGHKVMLHGCTIGENSLIGMGAILLGGSRVGDESIVAAGAVVRENFVVPPRSLVAGVPARIIREVSPEEIEMIARSADGYVKKIRQYLDGGDV